MEADTSNMAINAQAEVMKADIPSMSINAPELAEEVIRSLGRNFKNHIEALNGFANIGDLDQVLSLPYSNSVRPEPEWYDLKKAGFVNIDETNRKKDGYVLVTLTEKGKKLYLQL